MFGASCARCSMEASRTGAPQNTGRQPLADRCAPSSAAPDAKGPRSFSKQGLDLATQQGAASASAPAFKVPAEPAWKGMPQIERFIAALDAARCEGTLT